MGGVQNTLGNQYAVKALRERRAEVSGEIARLKRRLQNLTESLGHIDATVSLLDPETNPDGALDLKPRKTKPFANGKLTRVILDVLRRAGRPMSTTEVVEAVVGQLGYGPDAVRGMRAHVRTDLNYLVTVRGLVGKEGEGIEATWRLA